MSESISTSEFKVDDIVRLLLTGDLFKFTAIIPPRTERVYGHALPPTYIYEIVKVTKNSSGVYDLVEPNIKTIARQDGIEYHVEGMRGGKRKNHKIKSKKSRRTKRKTLHKSKSRR